MIGININISGWLLDNARQIYGKLFGETVWGELTKDTWDSITDTWNI